jgi:hypothetical protein
MRTPAGVAASLRAILRALPRRGAARVLLAGAGAAPLAAALLRHGPPGLFVVIAAGSPRAAAAMRGAGHPRLVISEATLETTLQSVRPVAAAAADALAAPGLFTVAHACIDDPAGPGTLATLELLARGATRLALVSGPAWSWRRWLAWYFGAPPPPPRPVAWIALARRAGWQPSLHPAPRGCVLIATPPTAAR